MRLKKALKVKPQKLELYNTGDKVFYKFGIDPQWHGPGTIIGTDNKVIFLRHGGNVISTSQTRLMKAGDEFYTNSSCPKPPEVRLEKEKKSFLINENTDMVDEDSDDDLDTDIPEDQNHQILPIESSLDPVRDVGRIDCTPIEEIEPTPFEITRNSKETRLPKKDDWIEYKSKDETTWYRAKI